MEAIIKAVKLVVESISKKIAKADEENITNEVIHALCKAAACTSEAYTKLKRISLEVDSEDSEDEDMEDGGTDSGESEDEDIEDGETDSEGTEDEDMEDDGADSEHEEDEDIEDGGTDSEGAEEDMEDNGADSEDVEDEDNGDDGTASEDEEENEMSLQDIIKKLRVIVSDISKQVIEVEAEHLDDITAAGVDITTSITTLDSLIDHIIYRGGV